LLYILEHTPNPCITFSLDSLNSAFKFLLAMYLPTAISEGLTPLNLVCLGAILGITAHLKFFIRGEWHVHAPMILCTHATAFMLLLSFLSHGAYLCTSYFLTLFGSIVLYRLLLHRLTRAGFDGPVLARVSKLWHVWHSRRSQNHLFLDKLYHQYGDFVRTGILETISLRSKPVD
jgi:hypothetical protein